LYTETKFYGFNQKTPQGKDQQAQAAQEAALESSQEAHLAAVTCLAGWFSHSRPAVFQQPGAGFCFPGGSDFR
jgi:hypothetical protein